MPPLPRKFNPAKWEHLLGNERRSLLDPDVFLDRLAIAPGSSVADVGAGPGFFTLPLAERVGPAGRVLATDVSPEMLRVLRARALPPQVEALPGEETRLPFGDASVDLVLLAFVLHELHEPLSTLAEIRRVLRPGGRLAMLEWVPQVEQLGPPVHARLSIEASERTLVAAGFAIAERGHANASNYYLVAT